MEDYLNKPGTTWLPDADSIKQATDAGRPLDMSNLWRQLASGEYSVVSSFCSASRCYVCLQRGTPSRSHRRFLTERNMAVLRRILIGVPQKVIASEFDLSPSTVSSVASRCLEALGMEGCIGKVPLVMVAAAHASPEGSSEGSRLVADCFDARQGEVGGPGVRLLGVSFCRPDGRLQRLLSTSRCEVARLRVEGLSYHEIAELRGTSPRTVANQLSTTFRQLSVSGRIELLHRLIRDELGAKPSGCRLGTQYAAPVSAPTGATCRASELGPLTPRRLAPDSLSSTSFA